MSGVIGDADFEGDMIGGGGAGYAFVNDGWRCWPNVGMGLAVELGSGMGLVDAAALAARFDTMCREYVG